MGDEEIDEKGLDAGSVAERPCHGLGEAACGPGPAPEAVLDLCRDMVLDGLEDDIDLDALLTGARRRAFDLGGCFTIIRLWWCRI